MNAIKRLIPNLLTAGNLVGGIMAIILTFTGRIEIAPWCIFASAIFDFLDGFVARLLKVQSELGKQLDSLADMVTFGVAPGLILYSLLGGYKGAQASHVHILQNYLYRDLELDSDQRFEILGDILPYAAFLIPIFALFRLAKFNLDTRQTSSFIGLPTPAMTLFFASFPILIIQGLLLGGLELDLAKFILNPIFIVVSIIVFSLLMVSEIPLFALKFKDFKFKGNEVRYIFLTICIGLLATLLLWSIPIIIILYLILSIINNALIKRNEV